jgi:hypothetical protein
MSPIPKLRPMFKRAFKPAAIVLMAALSTPAAIAADPARPDSRLEGAPGRYTMHPADGGFLRLDTQTGEMSMCQRASGAWNCSMLPDERVALERENQELKSAVKRLEEMAGVGDSRGKQAEKSGPAAQLPTEEDLDKAMSYVQRMLKKFKEKVRELEGMDRKGTNL